MSPHLGQIKVGLIHSCSTNPPIPTTISKPTKNSTNTATYPTQNIPTLTYSTQNIPATNRPVHLPLSSYLAEPPEPMNSSTIGSRQPENYPYKPVLFQSPPNQTGQSNLVFSGRFSRNHFCSTWPPKIDMGGDAWSCGQDGRAKRWNPRFASLPVEGITVSGVIPADKSGHVGYAAMTALCVMR